MTKVPKFIGLTLGVAVIGLFVYVGRIVYGSVIRNEISPRRYYYTVTADLSIGGKQLTMSGTTECLWGQHPVGPLVFDNSHFQMIGGPVAKRLADGSALLIWMGNLCGGQQDFSGALSDENSKVADAELARIGLGGKMQWYIAHLDDANAPRDITVYIGPEYFSLPETDIHLHNIKIRMTSSGRRTNTSDEIPWIQSDRAIWSMKGIPFFSYFARVVPANLWKQKPGLFRSLSAIKVPITDVYAHLRATGSIAASRDLTSILNSAGTVIQVENDDRELRLSTSNSDEKWFFVLRPQLTPPQDTRLATGLFVRGLKKFRLADSLLTAVTSPRRRGQQKLLSIPTVGCSLRSVRFA